MAKQLSTSNILRIIFGILFLITGFIGLLLPILPGWIFLILGAGLLGYPKIKKKIKEK